MNDLLLDTLVDKVNVQEMKMDAQGQEVKEMKEKVNLLLDNTAAITEVNQHVKELQTAIKNISFPEREMRELSDSLATGINLLKKPVRDEVVHHHHVPKITWVTAGLFLILCLMGLGWYNTGSKLDQYRANDIAWRFYKLKASPESLPSFHEIENIYRKDPEKMMKQVKDEEARNQQIEEAKRKAAEAAATIENLNGDVKMVEPVKKGKKKKG